MSISLIQLLFLFFGLCNVCQFIIVQSFNIIFLHERFDVLLDIGDFGWEARFHLLDYFLDKLDVLHLLAGFHNADDCGL